MKSNLAQSALAIAVSAAIGRQVLQKTEGAEHSFKITGIDADKTGSLKDKTKAPYMVITRDDDVSIVVHLHPKNAKNLLDTGADGEYTLTALSTESADTGAVEQTAEAGTGEVVANADGSPADMVQEDNSGAAAAAAEGTGESTVVEAAEKTDEPAAPSKKDLAIDAYIEMANEGKTRAEIIKHFVDVIGLTKPGAATYYQNCASNKAGWTEAVAEEGAPEGEVQAADSGAAGSTDATDVANAKKDEPVAAE